MVQELFHAYRQSAELQSQKNVTRMMGTIYAVTQSNIQQNLNFRGIASENLECSIGQLFTRVDIVELHRFCQVFVIVI